MKLSVIIPVYNVEKYIVRCVASVLDQKTDDYEIIIVNDGTPDRSIDVLCENISDPKIRIINQANGGLSAARNTGIENAEGEYLWFVDSDDWIEKDCLSKIISSLEETAADVLYIYADEIVGSKVYRRGSYRNIGVLTGKNYLAEYKKYNCAPFYVVKRDLLIKNNIRFYPGIYHEDNDYTPRMLYKAQRVAEVEGYFYHIFRHEGSITRTPNPKRLFDLIKIAENYKYHITTIPESDSHYYCNVVGNSINQAMFECSNYSKDIQDEVNHKISEGEFSKYLLGSSIAKYIAEGVLFAIFPKHCLEIYNFMQLFNRDKGNQKAARQIVHL